MKRYLKLVVWGLALFSALTTVGEAQARPKVATVINMQAPDRSALGVALREAGYTVISQSAQSTHFAGQVVVLEARGTLSAEVVEGLRTFVQQGGALLLGLDREPGPAPTQLSFLMPTTAWSTQATALSRPLVFNPVKTNDADAEFFPTGITKSVELPFFFPIRPVSAVERGAARYERYASVGSPEIFDHPAGTPFWTRPVLNRDWRVRLCANDRAASPLLITGRFGAGRVAVFASSLAGDEAKQTIPWRPVVTWLTEAIGASSPGTAEPSASAVEVLVADQRGPERDPDGADFTLRNRTSEPLEVQVISRVLTWEQAYLSDTISTLSLAANGTAMVKVPLPRPSPLGYQAVEWRRAFVVRLGVISQSGATLLAERTAAVDLTPVAGLELATDNLYRVDYPYASAPGIEALPGMQNHMGLPVMQYAYPPGAAVHATATVTNGVHNLAALASVKDATTPGNPSVVAINDEGARFNKPPRGGLEGYGTWNGKGGADNVLQFKFPFPVTITAVTLTGSGKEPQGRLSRNPGAIELDCDGRKVAQDLSLDQKFVGGDGVARISIAPVLGTVLTVRLPWMALVAGGEKREAPVLGEIEVEGSEFPLPSALQGEAQIVLRDSLSESEMVVATKPVSLAPGGRMVWTQGFLLPKANYSFYQLQLRFAGQTRTIPILAIQPKTTLIAMESERPVDAPTEGFVTTKGFRNLFVLGTGTRDQNSPWQTPDDLVYAYAHQLKQVSSGDVFPTALFTTDSDLRHYSTPWTFFPNGESVLTLGTPGILEGLRRQRSWSSSDVAVLGFGDRWDSGPSLDALAGWQELVAFDDFLAEAGKLRLQGKTHADLIADVYGHHASEWALWHEHRYVVAVDTMRMTFAAAGKRLNFSGQGIPMTSNADAAILSKAIKGMASDSTWGMDAESVPLTTGRQLAIQAFNPEWKLNFNVVWGYDSTTLNNGYWYGPVGTTEPSRRHYYDSAWRGIVAEDGEYLSSYAYGFGNNGGEAWTMSLNDYQQAWNAQERFSLLYPEHPLGAGLLVSAAIVDSPTSALFSGGGMGPEGKSEVVVHHVATAFERLHDAGLSIPYSASIHAVSQWGAGSAFILEDIAPVTTEEVASLRAMASRGARFVVFTGTAPLTQKQAGLLGLNIDGTPKEAVAAGTAGGVTLLTYGNFLSVPLQASDITPEASLAVAPLLRQWLRQAITFPEGTMGYGFTIGRQTMIVVEDWREEPREATLRLKATSANARAVGLNDHTSLLVQRDGGDWLIRVPIRAGDGEVVVLEQSGSDSSGKEERL